MASSPRWAAGWGQIRQGIQATGSHRQAPEARPADDHPAPVRTSQMMRGDLPPGWTRTPPDSRDPDARVVGSRTQNTQIARWPTRWRWRWRWPRWRLLVWSGLPAPPGSPASCTAGFLRSPLERDSPRITPTSTGTAPERTAVIGDTIPICPWGKCRIQQTHSDSADGAGGHPHPHRLAR